MRCLKIISLDLVFDFTLLVSFNKEYYHPSDDIQRSKSLLLTIRLQFQI